MGDITKVPKDKHASLFAALALAFASFGDAFLYPFLPTNFETLGLSIASVGILLSINRFVRILANQWVATAFYRYGARTVVMVGVTIAVSSTLGYAVADSFVYWFVLRVLWGIAFSILRLGCLAYAFDQQELGFSLGLSRGVQELGPLLIMCCFSVLVSLNSPTMSFMILATASLPALYFAFRLPVINSQGNQLPSPTRLRKPSLLNVITFTTTMFVDGILIVILAKLFLLNDQRITGLEATAICALYLGYRRFCMVLLAPLGGWVSDRIGIEKVFVSCLVLITLGTIIIFSEQIQIGCIIVFTFQAILTAVTPGMIQPDQQMLAGAATNATYRDVGAAVGTLVGGWLLNTTLIDSALGLGVGILFILSYFQVAFLMRVKSAVVEQT